MASGTRSPRAVLLGNRRKAIILKVIGVSIMGILKSVLKLAVKGAIKR
jgi:hypothetical protein